MHLVRAGRNRYKLASLPDDIPITLRGVKLSSKPADVPHGIRATSRALNGREAYEHGRGSRGVGQNGGECVFGCSVVEDAETSVGSDTASMYDALRDTLVVESVNLLHGDLVLEKSRSCAFRVRGLQPEIRRKAQLGRIGEGRGWYHV